MKVRILKPFQAYMASSSPGAKTLTKVSAVVEERGWRAVVFGGAVRDTFLHGVSARPRDLDIVVAGASVDDLARAFGATPSQRTVYGGIAKAIDGFPVDIWPLNSTWGIKHLGIDNPRFDDLMRTPFFNIDAIAVAIGGACGVYDGGFVNAMDTRTLDIVLEDNPFPQFNAMRALVHARRYGLRIGPRLVSWIGERREKLLGDLPRMIKRTPVLPMVDEAAYRTFFADPGSMRRVEP